MIRWNQARDEYLKGSERARWQESVGATQYHISMRHILNRYFDRVKRGHYRLSEHHSRGTDAVAQDVP